MSTLPEIDLSEFSAVAADWHDGQWSALYAVASTGKLSDHTPHDLAARVWNLEFELQNIFNMMLEIDTEATDEDREMLHRFSERINLWLADNDCDDDCPDC